MRNMTRCVNSQDEFGLDIVAMCSVHGNVHMCRGGESCNLTEEGTCRYTNKSFDGLARTQCFTFDGLSDFSSNTVALDTHRRGVKRKSSFSVDQKVAKGKITTDFMDLETFIANVHEGLVYVKKDTVTEEPVMEEPVTEKPLTEYMRALLTKIHHIMTYNSTIKRTAQVTSCDGWVNSTIQVLRSVQGKHLLPNITSTPTAKAIVVEALHTMKVPKQLWWEKKPCITRQWQL
jgi:hypothetical protein